MDKYSPDEHWSRTPEILRTPEQNANMFLDVMWVLWPILFFFIAVACAIELSNASRKRKSDYIILGIGAVFSAIVGLFGVWVVFIK